MRREIWNGRLSCHVLRLRQSLIDPPVALLFKIIKTVVGYLDPVIPVLVTIRSFIMAVIVWEAVVFTLFPLIGSFMGSSVTRPAIKSWYDVSSPFHYCITVLLLIVLLTDWQVEEAKVEASKLGIPSGLDFSVSFNGLRFLPCLEGWRWLRRCSQGAPHPLRCPTSPQLGLVIHLLLGKESWVGMDKQISILVVFRS